MIHITSKLHGVEVAGMRHPATTVHYREEQIEPEQLAEFKKSEYLTVEIDEPEGQTIETGAGDDATGDGIGDANTGDDVANDGTGETLQELDGTVEQVADGVAITEAESIAQAQPEPAVEAAATVEKKTAPASTRKLKK